MLDFWIAYHGYFLAFVIGYFLGSIPFGLIITKLAGKGDVRNIGSGNIGATNVLRTGSKKLAAATLLADVAKGAVAVLITLYFANSMNFDMFFVYLTGFFALLGHMYPIWLKFKGGKAVATFLGILIAGAFWGAIGFAVIWLATAYVTRYSSLAAFLGCIAASVLLFIMGNDWYIVISIMTVIIIAKHHQNISRLLKGNESKIGDKG